MAWIDYSYTVDTRIPAPIDWVWRFLVQPDLMPMSRESVVLVATAEGVPGQTGHVFFFEVLHDHGSHSFKTKVLRGEEPTVWVTLTEVAGWSGKEYYTLTALEGGLFTDVRFLGAVSEEAGERPARELDTLRRQRADEMRTKEEHAAAYFARVVTAAYEAQRQ